MFKECKKAEVEFDLKEEIGAHGTHSKVFLVYDKQLDADIAMKMINISVFNNTDDYFSESKILYTSEHTNVVTVKYACKDDTYVYIAMPYYKNGSLKNLINKRYLTVREIIRYGIHIISGLHNIHSKKLIHFDIKPDNILLSDNNFALVSDFGLAKPTNLSGIAGQDALYYKQKPPEAFDYDHFDYTYDIYQFGMLLYRMCNGDDVFYSQFNKYINTDLTYKRDVFEHDCKNAKFPNRNFYLEHIPRKLTVIIKKCLEVSPHSRYASVLEISNDLSEIDGNVLDWEYKSQPGKRIWEKKVDGTKFAIIINENSTSLATKQFDNGRVQKISNFCKENVNKQELKNFFEIH
jgi:serine/threonine protein kinase